MHRPRWGPGLFMPGGNQVQPEDVGLRSPGQSQVLPSCQLLPQEPYHPRGVDKGHKAASYTQEEQRSVCFNSFHYVLNVADRDEAPEFKKILLYEDMHYVKRILNCETFFYKFKLQFPVFFSIFCSLKIWHFWKIFESLWRFQIKEYSRNGQDCRILQWWR